MARAARRPPRARGRPGGDGAPRRWRPPGPGWTARLQRPPIESRSAVVRRTPAPGWCPTTRWPADLPRGGRPAPQVPDLGEADRGLRLALTTAATALADLDVARWRPEVADELMDLRTAGRSSRPAGGPAAVRAAGVSGARAARSSSSRSRTTAARCRRTRSRARRDALRPSTGRPPSAGGRLFAGGVASRLATLHLEDAELVAARVGEVEPPAAREPRRRPTISPPASATAATVASRSSEQSSTSGPPRPASPPALSPPTSPSPPGRVDAGVVGP